MKMLANKLILLLLPALAYSEINISVKPGNTQAESRVDFSGKETLQLSDTERKTFKVDSNTLKTSVETYFGKRPTDVYLNAPTPWGDLFNKYGWSPCQRTLTPVSAKIVEISFRPTIVSTSEYVNSHDSISALYTLAVEQKVEESVSNTWSKGGALTVGQEFTVTVGLEGIASISSNTQLSFTATWGQDKTVSRTVTLGATSAIQATVPPNTRVCATLNSSKGVIKVEVNFEATIDGDILANYENTYKGHHFWVLPLRSIQKRSNLPTTIKYTQSITIDFYTNSKLELTNCSTHAMIEEEPAGIVKVGDQKNV